MFVDSGIIRLKWETVLQFGWLKQLQDGDMKLCNICTKFEFSAPFIVKQKKCQTEL